MCVYVYVYDYLSRKITKKIPIAKENLIFFITFAPIKRILTIILLILLSLNAIAEKKDSVPVLHNKVYEKIRMALNDVDVFGDDRKYVKKYAWLRDFVETCDLNNKIILPLIVEEQVKDIYIDSLTNKRRTIIRGIRRSGLNDLFDTGQIVSLIMGDLFVDVDVRDEHMRFIGRRFFSPVSPKNKAHYNISEEERTDSTVKIRFSPKDKYDTGFTGTMVLSNDSTHQIRSVRMGLPKNSMVNFIDTLDIHQIFKRVVLPGDSLKKERWVLDKSTLLAEMSLVPSLGRVVFTKEEYFYDHRVDSVPPKVMSGKVPEKETTDPKAELRDTTYWQQNTRSMSDGGAGRIRPNIFRRLLGYAMDIKALRPFAWLTKALIDNYIPTSTPSYFDVGPVTSLISRNQLDKFRLRFGGQTTANLNKHFFVGGYYAHGFKHHTNYYDIKLIYSFNPKRYSPEEFPRRYIVFESNYDVCYLPDRNMHGEKDNIFHSFKWNEDSKMIFYNQQKLNFTYETDNGWKLFAGMKHDIDEATGRLVFKPLSEWNGKDSVDINSLHNGKIRLMEYQFGMEYSPGGKFYNTRYRQLPINSEMPVIGLSHVWGVKMFGGQYNHHSTELSLYKRFFLGSWGFTNLNIKCGAEWCQVPYPLLLSPASNLSYVYEDNYFHLCSTNEFVSDRFVQFLWSWEMNGKIFNLIPYVRNFKLREYVGIRAYWGWLTSKNDPRLPQNAGSDYLMAFTSKTYTLERGKPYLEGVVGIHNIFHIFNIDFVYRFDYMHLDKDVRRSGLRFSAKFTF